MSYIYTFFAASGDLLNVTTLPNSKSVDAPSDMLSTVLTITFATIGAVSLLMIVISGFRYILAAGDPGKMAQAKQAILYALIGLVVALSAFSIVTFVVKGAS